MARVPEAMTPSKQSPGEANKLFGVREEPALGVGEAAKGRRGGTKTRFPCDLRAWNLSGWALGLRVLSRWSVTTLQGFLSDNRYLSV